MLDLQEQLEGTVRVDPGCKGMLGETLAKLGEESRESRRPFLHQVPELVMRARSKHRSQAVDPDPEGWNTGVLRDATDQDLDVPAPRQLRELLGQATLACARFARDP